MCWFACPYHWLLTFLGVNNLSWTIKLSSTMIIWHCAFFNIDVFSFYILHLVIYKNWIIWQICVWGGWQGEGVSCLVVSDSVQPYRPQLTRPSIHGILQARTLEWVAISLSKRNCKKKVKSLSHVQLFATPWTIAYQAPSSMEFSRQEYWSGLPFPSPIWQI